jgi:hypothetical protein
MRQRRLLGEYDWTRYENYGLFGEPRPQAKYETYDVAG